MTTVPSGRPAGEAAPRSSFGAAWALVLLLLGGVIGFIIALTLFFDEFGSFTRWLDSVFSLILAAASGFIVGSLLVGLCAAFLLTRFLRRARATLKQVVSDAEAAAHAACDRDAKAAVKHTADAIRTVAAWYSDGTSRRFMVQTVLASLVAFGGLTGTVLLFRQTLLLGQQTSLLAKQNEKLDEQTSLLQEQNEKLDQQTITAEAQRRDAFSTEMSSLIQTVAANPHEALSRSFIARAVTLTHAATPFSYVKVRWNFVSGKTTPELTKEPLSPERGQLLVGLVSSGVDVPALVRAGVTFRGADLSGAKLPRANLSGVDLGDADLSSADLRGAVLHEADLRNANLRYADLRGIDLRGADLGAANLTSAVLTGLHSDGTVDPSSAVDLDGAIVSFYSSDKSRRLDGFPEGWGGQPPAGWEMFEGNNTFRLRRVGASSAAPPPPQ